MAQPSQMPIYPQIQMPPTILPIPGSEPAQLPAMKRRREDEFPPIQIGPEPQDSAPKRRAKAQDVIFRIVVPSRQIGKVIGKEGCRIQKIREETKATIKIADAIAVCNSLFHSQGFVGCCLIDFYCCFWVLVILQRHEERVIIISSKDSDNPTSDAENALQQIAGLILKVMSLS